MSCQNHPKTFDVGCIQCRRAEGIAPQCGVHGPKLRDDCAQCRDVQVAYHLVVKADGSVIGLHEEAAEIRTSRKEAARQAAAALPARERREARYRQWLLKTQSRGHLSSEVVRELDPYDLKAWKASVLDPDGPLPPGRPMDNYGRPYPIDGRVLDARKALAALASVKRRDEEKALQKGRVSAADPNTSAATVAQRAQQLGIEGTLARAVFQRSPEEVAAYEKKKQQAVAEAEAVKGLLAHLPEHERGAELKKAQTKKVVERVEAKVAQAQKDGRRPHASEFDAEEWPIYKDRYLNLGGRTQGTPVAPGVSMPGVVQRNG